LKFLVVEDVAIIKKVLAHYLKSFGDVEFAGDGMEALGKFCQAHSEEKAYDLVFLDIMLPKLNGFQILTFIRELESTALLTDKKTEFKPVKIIMVSSLSDAKAVSSAIEKGCDGYITKPFDKEKIMAELIKVGLIKSEN
jgi:two-component system chemotaxis response regulator CheY